MQIPGKIPSVIMTMMLVAATATLLATPDASAHVCKAYDDACNPNGCTEGQDHDHTRMHYWPKRDEHCSSKKPSVAGCQYEHVDLPQLVCDVLHANTTAINSDTGGFGDPARIQKGLTHGCGAPKLRGSTHVGSSFASVAEGGPCAEPTPSLPSLAPLLPPPSARHPAVTLPGRDARAEANLLVAWDR